MANNDQATNGVDNVNFIGIETTDPAYAELQNRLNMLEKFNGQIFFNYVTTGGFIPDGQTGGTVTEYYTPTLTPEQQTLINQSYEALRDYVHLGLLTQTRLKGFSDAVSLTFDGTDFVFNFSAMEAAMQARLQADPANGLADIIDFIKVAGKAYGDLGWDVGEYFGKIISSQSIDSASAALLARYGIAVGGAGDDGLSSTATMNTVFTGDGNDYIYTEYSEATIYAGAGNDTIIGSSSSDTLDGGAGDDLIIDRGGDTNILRGGAGNDTVTFACTSNNIVDGGAGNDLLKMDYSYYSAPSYANTFRGGAGDDRIESGASTDIYLFNRGDGQDTISDSDGYWYNYGAIDKLVLGAGIAMGDVTASQSGDNLIIKVADPVNPAATDQVTIEGWNYSGQRIEQIEFSDGTVWTAADLSRLAMTGTDGADSMTLWSDATWADGKGGDDTIYSGYSDATIYGGDGNDTITDHGGSDTIDGGAGDDVIDDWGGDTNTLRGGDGNDTVIFSYWSNNTIEGGAGNDLLKMDYSYYSDPSHANTIRGGAGDDRIESGSGADTYLFNRGDGQDTVSDYGDSYYSSGATDVAEFGDSITADQLWFSRVGDNLEVSIIGASDAMTIENWYFYSGYHIEQFKTSDGRTLLDSQVDNLVSAMAAFNPPAAGQTTLPQDYQEALAPVIAANWR